MDARLFKRIDTVFVPVRDLDAAVSWYTRALGLSLRWKQANYAALDAAQTALTLYQPEGELRPFTDHAPFNLYATDVQAAHRTLQAAGAQVEPIQVEPGVSFFDFRDPDGNRLGICSFPEP